MPDTYFVEWERTGYLWRLEIQLPGPILTAGERVFYQIPADVIVAFGDVELGFEKSFIGLRRTGVLKLRVDLQALDRTEELRALRAWILRPVLADAGTMELFAGESRTFPTATMWTVCCDGGAGYAPGSENLRNSVVVQCQQRPLPALRHQVRRGVTRAARSIVDVTLVDTFRAALETVSPDDVARRLVNAHTAVGPHAHAFDIIYRHAGVNYLRAEREPGQPKLRRHFYGLRALYNEVEQAARSVYVAITRDALARVHLYSGLHHIGEIGGTPYDHWDFAKWDYTRLGQPVWGLTADDLYFCGRAYLSDNHFTADPDELVGGLLVRQGNDESQQSLYRFRTMYDFLRVSCEAAGVKGVVWQKPILQAARRELTCYFRPIAAGDTTPKVIPTDRFEGQDVDIDEPSSLITRAKVAIPGLEGDDKSEYDSAIYWGHGIEDEEDENLRALFHNCPRIGDEKNIYQTFRGLSLYGGGSGSEEPIPEVNDTYVGVMSKGLTPWKLYYFDQPHADGEDITSEEVPIRVHCTTAMAYGDAPAEKGYGGFISTTLPLLTAPSSTAIDRWWDELFGVYVDMYDNASMAAVLAETVAHVFGNPAQVGYPELTLRMGGDTVVPNDIGEQVQIGDSGTASIFLVPDATYYDHLSTVVFPVSMTISIRTGAAKVDFLHVEKP